VDGAAGPGSVPEHGSQGDSLHGKSREEILRLFQEQQKDLDVLKAYAHKTSNFFELDDRNQLVGKKDMWMAYANSKGWQGPPNPQAQAQHQANGNGTGVSDDQVEKFREAFEDNPRQAIADMVKTAIGEAVQPLQQDVIAQRNEKWISDLRTRYPDFSKYEQSMARLVQDRNLTVQNQTDLESIYQMAKLQAGGFVDKEQADAQRKNLESALTAIQPGAHFGPPINEMEATPEQLLGITQGEKQRSSSVEALFGKPYLRD
jgi:hypothetical protein